MLEAKPLTRPPTSGTLSPAGERVDIPYFSPTLSRRGEGGEPFACHADPFGFAQGKLREGSRHLAQGKLREAFACKSMRKKQILRCAQKDTCVNFERHPLSEQYWVSTPPPYKGSVS
ncbi:MAG TPA: hypothetical protein VGX94_04990 [Terriglobia bacterium]|nr:hypothetical protein [Terriglobia bacterium]